MNILYRIDVQVIQNRKQTACITEYYSDETEAIKAATEFAEQAKEAYKKRFHINCPLAESTDYEQGMVKKEYKISPSIPYVNYTKIQMVKKIMCSHKLNIDCVEAFIMEEN